MKGRNKPGWAFWLKAESRLKPCFQPESLCRKGCRSWKQNPCFFKIRV